MSRFFQNDFRKFLGSVLLLIGIIGGGSIFFNWYLYDPNLIDSVKNITAGFKQLVFDRNDRSSAKGFFVKWDMPITVRFTGEWPNLKRSIAEQDLKLVDHLTGIKISIVQNGDSLPNIYTYSNLFFQFQKEIITDWGSENFYKKTSCTAFHVSTLKRNIYFSKIVVTEADRATDRSKSCIIHELFHAFGMAGHNLAYSPSRMRPIRNKRKSRLTINDKIILRALYDPRLHPGMKQHEAMIKARKIISELVKAVKEKDITALYQQ